ncbi:hypothetical protein C9374_003415 [Naegleria lovaniensis]|uniref:Uncharacterized protein n=1 Tax=Naegleria lovaniensis TaxID=51637 RepID=A0AA88KJG2_NAELO|nr:uncharacterized protein C9374_003415 [Naegleria lovaniensis]KAG2385600.1 hypothetical protein C9374_003415 [Naegleria lovaniensis]
MGNRQSQRQHQGASGHRPHPHKLTNKSVSEIRLASVHDKSFSSSLSDSLDFTHMFSMGQNDKGQLGRGIMSKDDIESYPLGPILELHKQESASHTEEEQLEINSRVLKDIKFVATGRSHLLMATHCNKLYGMGFNNYSQLGFPQDEENIPRLREITLPESVTTIDGVAAGWFHSIVVCDQNKIFAAGHSFFDQTFDVKMEPNFQRSIRMDFLQRDKSKVTTVSATTFSSSLVVDNWKIYACGEMNANSNPTNYLVPGCEVFKREVIKKFKHADKGLVALCENGRVYFATKERPFHILMENIHSITPSHMYETTYTLEERSTILSECDLAPYTKRSNINVAAFIEKYGMDNVQLYCGYCFYYLVVNKKRVYTINGSELNEVLNLEGISTSINIKEVVATSDCSYFIFERCLFTAAELLMKSRLKENEKFADIEIVATCDSM